MSNSGHAVHFIGVVLTNTMPMNRSTVARHTVGNVNDNLITPACGEQRTRKLTVDTKSFTFHTIRSDSTFCQIKIVLNRVTSLGNDSVRIIAYGIATISICARLTFATDTGTSRRRF